MQLQASNGADANRSVPPRWLARDAVAAAQTEPPASGERGRRASDRDAAAHPARPRVDADHGACAAPSATQIAPSPAAIATGLPPTRTVSLTASVAASIRVTVPSSRLATQTPP